MPATAARGLEIDQQLTNFLCAKLASGMLSKAQYEIPILNDL